MPRMKRAVLQQPTSKARFVRNWETDKKRVQTPKAVVRTSSSVQQSEHDDGDGELEEAGVEAPLDHAAALLRDAVQQRLVRALAGQRAGWQVRAAEDAVLQNEVRQVASALRNLQVRRHQAVGLASRGVHRAAAVVLRVLRASARVVALKTAAGLLVVVVHGSDVDALVQQVKVLNCWRERQETSKVG